MRKTEQELILKEDKLIRISYTVLFTCFGIFASAAVWVTSIQVQADTTDKNVEAHIVEIKEYQKQNDARWLLMNNSLIRIQERLNIKVPREELENALSPYQDK